jgi:dTDP-4-dehydrorhamnose 3,5-epimerase
VKYTPTGVAGVTIIDIEPHRDDRGSFSHSFCANEFAAYGLLSNVAQTSLSYNYARGTLRGMHRQVPPHAEAKLVRCTRGAIVDVAVDGARSRTPTASTSWCS